MARALVTGAARRVGRGIAVELARAGFDVVVHYHRSESEAEAVVAELRGVGTDAVAMQADLGTVAGCSQLIEQVCAHWDGLEVLVNNASVFEGRSVEATDLAHWDAMFSINTRAPFLLAQGLLPHLRAGALTKHETHGVIVNLADIGGERPVRGHTAYSMSKAALVMLTRCLAVELAPVIRTVAVSPGQVAWPEHYGASLKEQLMRRIPMGRVGSPEEVARLVRFLILEGHYLNGVVVPIDGGQHVRY